MTFQELKNYLSAMSRQAANELADAAKVPHSTVAKIRKGHTQQPRITTVESLSRAIQLLKKRKPIKSATQDVH